MGNWIELPQTPQGTAEEQMRQMYSYLYRVAETLNHNLSEIGSMDLTDEERVIMQAITEEAEGEAAAAYDWQGKESLKSLIIKTAAFVQNELNAYRLNLLGEYVTEGKFGKYVRHTNLKVDVTPTGIQQDFTFEEVVQGLKNYTINAKNYIKTGLLREVGGLPVYGVAIGKDVVTFSEDGTETYNDGNKVAELTADELSFYQNGNKVASYKGNRISFLMGGAEVFYIESGKIHSNIDLELSSGKKLIINTTNFKVDSNGNVEIIGTIKAGSTFAGTMSANCITSGSIDASVIEVKNINASKINTGTLDASVVTVNNLDASKITTGTMSANKISGGSIDASNVTINNLDASKITTGTMSANKISGGSIDASNVTITNLNASNITSGTMSANKISGGSIDASNVTITNLNASNITSGTMSANKISGGSIDASNVTITNLNASNITSGTMSASKISGGTLIVGGNNNANGIIQIKDNSGTQIGTIDKSGIDFSGDLKISSGGTIDVDSTNFKIDSVNKYITIYDTSIDSSGMYIDGGNNYTFRIFGNSDGSIPLGNESYNFSISSWYDYVSTGENLINFRVTDRTTSPIWTYWLPFRYGNNVIKVGCDDMRDSGNHIFQEVWYYGSYIIPQVDSSSIYPISTYIGTSSNRWYYGYFKYIDGDYITYNTLVQNSSRDIKHDIQNLPSVGEKLDGLNPVTFVYDEDTEERTRMGLIYEDTLEVMPEICTQDESNKAINYVELIPALVKEIQSLRQRVSDLERRMEDVHDSGNADE